MITIDDYQKGENFVHSYSELYLLRSFDYRDDKRNVYFINIYI